MTIRGRVTAGPSGPREVDYSALLAWRKGKIKTTDFFANLGGKRGFGGREEEGEGTVEGCGYQTCTYFQH